MSGSVQIPSHVSVSAGRGVWLERALLVCIAGAVVGVLQLLRPLPFASTCDGPIYYLPLIHFTSDAVLAGHWPFILWDVGGGWAPGESGQTSPGYPIYLFANLLARALHDPFAMLEVSAAIHLALAGLLVRERLRRRERWTRLTAAIVAIAQPAPLLLGISWHNYLASYPWAVALFCLFAIDEDDAPPSTFLVVVANTLFYWTAHPQMYVLGWLLLGAWLVAARGVSPRRWRPHLVGLVAAQLAVVMPLFWLWLQARGANYLVHEARAGADFLLGRAVPLWQAAGGSFVGNLTRLGHNWAKVRTVELGLFYAPLWQVLVYWVVRRKSRLRAASFLLFLGCVFVFLAPRGIEAVKLLAHGPLAEFRWTWKLTMFALPWISLRAVVILGDERARLARTSRWWKVVSAAPVVVATLGIGVILQGHRFEIWQPLVAHHARGVHGLVDDARAALAALPPRASKHPHRIAFVGANNLRNMPASFAGLHGEAVLLSGVESVHIFEHLEDNAAAADHLRLAASWLNPFIDADAYRARPRGMEAALGAIGATALVTTTDGLFPNDERTYRVPDALGRPLWLRTLPDRPLFPWAQHEDGAQRLVDGTLVSHASEPPQLLTSRPMSWARGDDGTWRGTTERNVAVPLSCCIGFVGALLLAWRGRRRA